MENKLVKIIPDLKINVNRSDLSVSVIESDQTGDTLRKGNYRFLGLKFLKETIRAANYQRKILPEELIEITSFIRMRNILKLISKLCLIYFLPPIKRRFDKSLKNLNILKENIENGISNSYVNIRFNLSDISRNEYEKVQNSFNNLLKTHIVWRITSTSEVDQVKERSSASSSITRVPTEIRLDQLVGIRCDTKAFLFKSNRGIQTGRNIFIYPGF